MSSLSNLENVKGLFSLLDHQSLAEYLESEPNAFELKETHSILKVKGYRPAANFLLKIINRNPHDQEEIIRAFGLSDLAGDPPTIKASHLWKKVLNSPAMRRDLEESLGKSTFLKISPRVKKALGDLLKILDFLDNEKPFIQGTRPGSKIYQEAFINRGTVAAIKTISRTLTPQDIAQLAKLFEIEDKMTARTLLKKVLPWWQSDSDLKAALCKVDPSVCPYIKPIDLTIDMLHSQVTLEGKNLSGGNYSFVWGGDDPPNICIAEFKSLSDDKLYAHFCFRNSDAGKTLGPTAMDIYKDGIKAGTINVKVVNPPKPVAHYVKFDGLTWEIEVSKQLMTNGRYRPVFGFRPLDAKGESDFHHGTHPALPLKDIDEYRVSGPGSKGPDDVKYSFLCGKDGTVHKVRKIGENWMEIKNPQENISFDKAATPLPSSAKPLPSTKKLYTAVASWIGGDADPKELKPYFASEEKKELVELTFMLLFEGFKKTPFKNDPVERKFLFISLIAFARHLYAEPPEKLKGIGAAYHRYIKIINEIESVTEKEKSADDIFLSEERSRIFTYFTVGLMGAVELWDYLASDRIEGFKRALIQISLDKDKRGKFLSALNQASKHLKERKTRKFLEVIDSSLSKLAPNP